MVIVKFFEKFLVVQNFRKALKMSLLIWESLKKAVARFECFRLALFKVRMSVVVL